MHDSRTPKNGDVETMEFNKNDRYLEHTKNGRILIWTKRLAARNDMREFFPDFPVEKKQRTKAVEIPEVYVPTAESATAILPTEFSPLNDGRVTMEFLLTRTKDEIQDYGLTIFKTKINKSKSLENMADEILELQKTLSIEE